MRYGMVELAKRQIVARRHRRNEARSHGRGPCSADPRVWGMRVTPDGALEAGGCELRTLAETYGTPLIVADLDKLATDYHAFKGAFEARYPRVELAYSYKTNPLPGVIAALHGLGAMAEVISHFELWLALELGVAPERIIFNGPAKNRESLELAIASGVGLINLDGLEELELVSAIARQAKRRQAVGVRVTTSVGWASQFGMAIAGGEAAAAFRRITSDPWLEAAGLHIHLGTNVRDVSVYRQAVGELCIFAHELTRSLNVSIGTIDVGGGYAVPTVRPFDDWDQRLMRYDWPPAPIAPEGQPRPADYARAIAETVRAHAPTVNGVLPTLVLEPGRALTSSAQSLLLRVLGLKRRDTERPVVILDGGKNITVPLGYEQHELLPVDWCVGEAHCYDFYGPLCHPSDRLFAAKRFPRLEPDDFVAVMDAGAYFVPNQRNFSHARPAAVAVQDGKHRLLRARESFADIVRNDGLSKTAPKAFNYDPSFAEVAG